MKSKKQPPQLVDSDGEDDPMEAVYNDWALQRKRDEETFDELDAKAEAVRKTVDGWGTPGVPAVASDQHPPIPDPREERRVRRGELKIQLDGCGAGCTCERVPDIMPLEYAEAADADVLEIDEEIWMWVAADSGAVDHVTPPKSLPGSLEVTRTSRTRDFVAANNDPIKNHGECTTTLEQENGTEVQNVFQVAEVSRPLHSVSKICDNQKEMLFMQDQAVVVPAGTFANLLGSVRVIAKYPRQGGLYVAKMKAKNPKAAKTSSFGRPGARR